MPGEANRNLRGHNVGSREELVEYRGMGRRFISVGVTLRIYLEILEGVFLRLTNVNYDAPPSHQFGVAVATKSLMIA